MTFIGGAVTFIGGAMTFVSGATTFVGGAVTFISKGNSAVGGRSFETAGAGVVNNIKGVNKRGDLRRWLIIYKLKGPLVLINSLISASDHSIELSS
jgi:hypothetical protein